MSSVMRRTGNRSAVERPMVGDTKTSMVREDHLGWLKCDGRELLKSEYVTLYAVLGDSFGTASSPDKFVLPDALGRVMGLIGQADVTTWVDGDVSGEETHTLTIAEMPSHTHGSVNVSGNTDGDGLTGVSGEHSHTSNDNPPSLGLAQRTGSNTLTTSDTSLGELDLVNAAALVIDPSGNHQHTIGRTGGSQAHNNMQPTLFLGNLFIFSGRPTFGAFDTVGSAGPNYFPPRVASRLF